MAETSCNIFHFIFWSLSSKYKLKIDYTQKELFKSILVIIIFIFSMTWKLLIEHFIFYWRGGGGVGGFFFGAVCPFFFFIIWFWILLRKIFFFYGGGGGGRGASLLGQVWPFLCILKSLWVGLKPTNCANFAWN